MGNVTRRDLVCGTAVALAASLARLRLLAEAVKPVKIRDLDIFPIDVPVSPAERDAGFDHLFTVVRVETDAGVRGYSFAGTGSARVLSEVRALLVGQDLFAVERHLRRGLIRWGGVEHALWDAIGKIAGQPVYKLLGGTADRVKAYVTCVWRGNPDQSHVSYREQAAVAGRLKRAGFRGMKIRAWRPNPMDDVAACRAINEEVGPEFAVMFDHTADRPRDADQSVWHYETGQQVAHGLQEAGAAWLEEPFARDDYISPARLAAEVEMPITGGGYTIYDLNGKVKEKVSGPGGDATHLANFLDGIRGEAKPNSEILEGHSTTLLCHLGNIAHRTGRTLSCDPKDGRILHDDEAMTYWTREYATGWEPKV